MKGGNFVMKRMFAVVVVLIMVLSLVACQPIGTGTTQTTSGTQAPTAGTSESQAVQPSGKIFSDDVELRIIVGSHASYPYDENWKIWQYVKEALGGNVIIEPIMDSWDTKISLLMASRDQLPDVLHAPNKTTVDRYALDGAFVSIMDNLDKLPNFKKWMDTTPESEAYIRSRVSGDGNVYHFPTYGLHTVNNIRTWLYRKDIFEEHKLEVPQDWNELYAVGKKLKELYPDSYPICNREALNKLSTFGPQWKPYMQNKFYYDFVNNKWSYGIIEPEFRELFTMYKKFYDEGLLPVNLMTMVTNDWRTLVANNQGFIFNDYLIRIDMFQSAARVDNPNFTLTALEPPKGLTPNATRLMPKSNSEYTGYVVCNTGKKDRIANAFKYVDWFYSDEGKEIISWGKEGETYKVVDGRKQFILDEQNTPARNLYGVGTYGLYQLVDVESNEALYTDESNENAHRIINWLEPQFNPYEWLSLNEEEVLVKQEIEVNIDSFVNDQLSKFFLGERPMSEWDNFVQEIYNMGLEQMLEVYEQAYARTLK
jgi:putative aldouronate transport system substrate-binding protein